MRIAQIAPLAESVPPKLYGGTERVVSYLTDELVAMGHDVTLFASGDSRTSAALVAGSAKALRLDPMIREPLACTVAMIEKLWRMRGQFDIIHNHVDYVSMPLLRRQATPALTTLHGRLDWPELATVYREFRDHPVVSISGAQQMPLPWMNWIGTVHHGLPQGLLAPPETPTRDYLAFLGRISPEKGPEAAIRLALRTGMPLKIAAKVDRADHEYYASIIKPLIDGRNIEYIGEIGETEKAAFLGNAYALMFMIDWPEPFGIVMIESMACGTPIVAMRRGSVPEVIEHGVTGFVVDSEADALSAIGLAASLDRRRIRREFERRFSSGRMARDYLKLYALLAEPEDSPLLVAEG
ncbi:MAG TPA: glycosyltransferase family 4 protein [Alphaproteobacteria bacterium]|nr:glycosyltransferase family 4 protein [Alphaproteobacteria bacterium]